MLANERLILKMSIGQKVNFITSVNDYYSSKNDGYEFPVLHLAQNPLKEGVDKAYSTQFPSDRALASSFNMPLIKEVYDKHAKEACKVKPYAYFNVTDDKEKEGVSSQGYLTAKFVASKVNGLRRGKQFVNFEEYPAAEGQQDAKRLIRDGVLSNCTPDSVYAKSVEAVKDYKNRIKECNLIYGTASDCEEALRLIFNGATLVFLKSDFCEELTKRLTKLTVAYREAYADYRADVISLTEFDRRANALEILDENLLNEACDRLVSTLVEMRARSAEPLPDVNAINSAHEALFDEASHDALSITAARQGAVLLKNDGILPLTATAKVAVLGEYGKDFSYQSDFFATKPTVERIALYATHNYEINGVDFASGYERGRNSRQDLLDNALNVCEDADCAIVWLCAEEGEKTLPQGQLELLEELKKKSIKTVAVVASDGDLDLSFAEHCNAVLLTYRGGQGVVRAVLDLLKGIATPSGRLTKPVYAYSDGVETSNVLYPFGYGLSYTKFEYSNLKINGKGLSCTVKNVGANDGFAVVQFYLQKEGSCSVLGEKTLKGFAKVYIKRKDAVRVEIPFDDNTFRTFDESKGLYGIEGGEYRIFISENYSDDKLTGSVTLSHYEFKDVFENQVTESVAKDGGEVKFDETQEPPEARKAKKQLSFGLKLFVAILVAIYYNGVLAVLAFTDVVSVKDTLFYIIIGVIALILNALFITYVCVAAKKRPKQKYVQVNDVLSDMVEKVDEFEQIAKVTYRQPVPEEVEDEDELLEMQAKEEEKPKSYDLSFAESEEEVSFVEQVTFNELCNNFRDFVKSKGVNVDVASVRLLLSAISAGKITVVSTKNTDLLPDFITALCAYFGENGATYAKENWQTEQELLWRQDGDKFVVSEFANAVYSATKTPDKICTAVVADVTAENVSGWFAPFINYANHPTEEHTLKLNEELSFRLPDNVSYVLVTKDGAPLNLSREVTDACLQTELVLSKVDNAEAEEVEIKSISKNALIDLVKEARETFFLPEKLWKKLDELFEAVRANEKFKLGNKNTLQLEKFTSVLLECGGDEAECLISAFLAKIVPVLKLTRAYRQDGGEKTLFGIIEKLFNEEDLTKVQKALSKTA
ncbi:MAG: hypothetical protein HDQ88_03045 [Clostridia bacterium]|nr:hypothetical protein [Clostridia bacterium]